jgi:hypothetical protein
MKIKAASDYFHGKEGYNCAQAVLKAFQPESGMSEATIQRAQMAGGGRAQGGVCGALYAAHIILGEKQPITSDFIRRQGSSLCSDIKVSECQCRKLVEVAAELTNEHLHKVDNCDPDYVFERKMREVEMLPKS